MSFQTVPAGNGLQWPVDAVKLILGNPTPFALMGLLLAIIANVPILGGFALAILGPALYGGVMYAANEQQSGRTADFQHLFQAFREEGKLGRMLMLCLPGLAAAVLIGILAVVFLGGALLSAGVAGATDSGVVMGLGLGVGGLMFAVLAIAIGIAAAALTFFATPQVMLKSSEPIPAMKQSARACIDNIGAVLLFAAVVILATIVASIVLSVIPYLGQLLLATALIPIMAVSSFVAWRQVYRHDITQELQPASAPPSPPPTDA